MRDFIGRERGRASRSKGPERASDLVYAADLVGQGHPWLHSQLEISLG